MASRVSRFFNLALLKISISVLLILSGLFLLGNRVLVPIIKVQAEVKASAPVKTPIASSDALILSASDEKPFKFDELGGNFIKDSDNAENELEDLPVSDLKPVRKRNLPEYFYLTIPKLEISGALVEINSGSLDPAETLGHYNGSCLPDEACGVFIYGHSTYSDYENKYEDGDYRGIFSRLGELEYGDEFYISYNGSEYRYIVDKNKIEKPEEINPLENPYADKIGSHESSVVLFTCTPPGTTKYRLSVIGKLVK